jgi:hypothetical protein
LISREGEKNAKETKMARAWSNVEPDRVRELESFVMVLDRVTLDLTCKSPDVPITGREREAAMKQVKLLRKAYQEALRTQERV